MRESKSRHKLSDLSVMVIVEGWRQLKIVSSRQPQPAKHIYTYTQTNLLNTHLYLISSGNSLRQQSNIVIGMFLAHNSARLNVQYTLSKHAHTLYFIYCTVVDIISFIFFSTAVVVFITIAYMFLLD